MYVSRPVVKTDSLRFPKISGKLSACANSGYQALSFPAHREPGYEARCLSEVYSSCMQFGSSIHR